jgi:hypothetical protein
MLPRSDWALDRAINASAECWHLLAEVSGFQMSHPTLNQFSQLTADAYAAQHAGGTTPRGMLANALVGLHLALDKGANALQVRSAHQQMGNPDRTWPEFRRPEDAMDAVTVLDVAEAGVRSGSLTGHQRSVQEWAAAVWRAWWPQHSHVEALARRLLHDEPPPFG